MFGTHYSPYPAHTAYLQQYKQALLQNLYWLTHFNHCPSLLVGIPQHDLSLYFGLQLLDYVSTTIFFSDKNVDSNLIAWNRVVLLHGKTIKACLLAQQFLSSLNGCPCHVYTVAYLS